MDPARCGVGGSPAQAFGIRFIHVEHGIRNALCGLMPHARQALKFIDEPFERRYVITGH